MRNTDVQPNHNSQRHHTKTYAKIRRLMLTKFSPVGLRSVYSDRVRRRAITIIIDGPIGIGRLTIESWKKGMRGEI